MKITDVHPLYAKRLRQWQRCRDFVEGADALRDHDISLAGEATRAYLPKLSPNQEASEYEAYVRRALYENRVARTKDGFIGLIFGKASKIELPSGLDAFLDDADLAGQPFEELVEEVASELIEVSRCGLLVDRPPAEAGASRLDEERAGRRPYVVLYKTEAITNWERRRIGARSEIVRIVLRETATNAVGEQVDQYRELILEEGRYLVRLWQKLKSAQAEDWAVVEELTPTMNGAPLDRIPFFFVDPRGGRVEPVKPMLLDLVEVAWSHYRSSADLEHARFACSVPTAYFLGFSKEEVAGIVLGGLNGIHSTAPDASVGYLEYTGQGTEPLERALKAKAETMAKLGSRMLSEDKREAETAETMKIRASGESSTLADVTRSMSRIASKMLELVAAWSGLSGKCAIELPTEFTSPSADPAEITALVGALTEGAIPLSVFLDRMRKLGVIEADKTDEELEAEIETQRARREESALDAIVSAAIARQPGDKSRDEEDAA